MQTLRFPGDTAATALPAPRLSEILSESAYLLEASRDSDDADVREASIDLALKSLRAASIALGADDRPQAPKRPLGKIVQGPWPQA